MKITESLKSIFSGQPSETVELKVVDQSFASLERINEISAERRRLRQLKSEQVALAPSLKSDIAGLDRQRIDLLTESLVEDSAEKKVSAHALDEQIQGKQKRLADIGLIVAGIDKKIGELDKQFAMLEPLYRRDLGQFLGVLYAELAKEYSQKATEMAELILQITAMKNVMNRHKAGNAGYVDQRFFLPGIVPERGENSTPIIDASTPAFVNGVRGFENPIQDQLMQAGFVHRFD